MSLNFLQSQVPNVAAYVSMIKSYENTAANYITHHNDLSNCYDPYALIALFEKNVKIFSTPAEIILIEDLIDNIRQIIQKAENEADVFVEPLFGESHIEKEKKSNFQGAELKWQYKKSFTLRIALDLLESEVIQAVNEHYCFDRNPELERMNDISQRLFCSIRWNINSHELANKQGLNSSEEELCFTPVVWSKKPRTYFYDLTPLHCRSLRLLSLPAEDLKTNILAWTQLVRITSAYHISIDLQCIEEIKAEVKKHIFALDISKEFVDYWTKDDSLQRIEEIVFDVIGALFQGPAGAIGQIGYLQGVYGRKFSLINPHWPSHSAPFLRAIISAHSISKLNISGQQVWKSLADNQIFKNWPRSSNKNFAPVFLDKTSVDFNQALDSTVKIADLIMTHSFKCLNHQNLTELFVWNRFDDHISNIICEHISSPHGNRLPIQLNSRACRHVIAGAFYATLKTTLLSPKEVLPKMLAILEQIFH